MTTFRNNDVASAHTRRPRTRTPTKKPIKLLIYMRRETVADCSSAHSRAVLDIDDFNFSFRISFLQNLFFPLEIWFQFCRFPRNRKSLGVSYWCLTSCQLLRDIKTTQHHHGGGGVVVEDNGVNITNSLSEPCLQGRNTGTRWKRQGSILYFSKPDVQYILLKY